MNARVERTEKSEGPRVQITLERDMVVLVLEATEAAAEDAARLLEVAQHILRDAQKVVAAAEVEVDQSASRASFARLRVERAIEEAD